MPTILEKPVILDETGQDIVTKLDEIKEAIGGSGEYTPIRISVTTPPYTTSYAAGETLDLSGMVVKATFSNGLLYDVTDQCTFSPDNGDTLTMEDTSVSISYTWAPTSTTFTATQAITVEPPIYGVEWDGSNTNYLTRTDASAEFVDPVSYQPSMTGTPGSPFDNIMPWSGIEIVDDDDAGKLVKIPKFYYKLDVTNGFKLQISGYPVEGFSVSPGHMDRGDGEGERDYIYVGRYHCAASTYKSTSGASPATGVTAPSTAKTALQNIGSDIWVLDKAARQSIEFLYLVEYANWSMKQAINKNNQSLSTQVSGDTDSMPYHTGRSSSNHVQYRYMEDLNTLIKDLLGGIIEYGQTLYSWVNPDDYGNVGAASTKLQSDFLPSAGLSGIIKSFACPSTTGMEWIYYPASSDTTGYTYNRASVSGSGSHNMLHVYSSGYAASSYDIFSQEKYDSTSSATYGCRLMKLPVSS